MYMIVLSILYNFHEFLIGVRDVGVAVGDDLVQFTEVVEVGLVYAADLAYADAVYHGKGYINIKGVHRIIEVS